MDLIVYLQNAPAKGWIAAFVFTTIILAVTCVGLAISFFRLKKEREVHKATIKHSSLQHGVAVIHAKELAEKLEVEQQLRTRAESERDTDELTELPNRRMFMLYAQQRMYAHYVFDRDSVTTKFILFLDLDRFKQINDTYGHDFGDRALKRAAARMRSVVRKEDLLARLGGDEFVVYLECTREVTYATVARLKQAVSQGLHFLLVEEGFESETPPSVSVGVAEYGKDGTTLEELKRVADMHMYKDKLANR